jgi:hypothetical protein
MDGADYLVLTHTLSAQGEVGDVVVSGRALNGFLIEYTGSAARAEIGYVVVGRVSDDAPARHINLRGRLSSLLSPYLSEYERDYSVRLYLTEPVPGSGSGGAAADQLYTIVADLPAREYVIAETGEKDEFGFPVLSKTAKPFDSSRVNVTLWGDTYTLNAADALADRQVENGKIDNGEESCNEQI